MEVARQGFMKVSGLELRPSKMAGFRKVKGHMYSIPGEKCLSKGRQRSGIVETIFWR